MGLPETTAGSSFIRGGPIVQWRRRVLLQPGVIGFGTALLFWSLKGVVRAKGAGSNSGDCPVRAGLRMRLVGLAQGAGGRGSGNECLESCHGLVMTAKILVMATKTLGHGFVMATKTLVMATKTLVMATKTLGHGFVMAAKVGVAGFAAVLCPLDR